MTQFPPQTARNYALVVSVNSEVMNECHHKRFCAYCYNWREIPLAVIPLGSESFDGKTTFKSLSMTLESVGQTLDLLIE